MTGTPPQSESDIQDSLGELLNMFIKLLARALENHELVEIIAPFIPKAVLTQNFPPFLQPETGFAHYGFYLPGMIMRLTLFENPAPVQHKPIKELSPADIIAQNIPSPKNRRITLLRESTVLNERYIQTLIGNIKPGKNTVSIPIIEASLLSKGIYSD